jgi:hypothetical protein
LGTHLGDHAGKNVQITAPLQRLLMASTLTTARRQTAI